VVRGLKARAVAFAVAIACGACTSILGDFSSGGSGATDGGATGLIDSTVATEAGGSTDATTGAGDSGTHGGDSTTIAPGDDSGDDAEDSSPTFAADASCEGGPCVNAIWANGDHTCAIMADQTLKCWGNNEYGQSIWNGPMPYVTTPTTVTTIDGGLLAVKVVRLGDRSSCALLVDNSMWCWGDNTSGQIGVPDAGAPDAAFPVPPTQVYPPGSVSIIAVGAYQACAELLTDAAYSPVYCWGQNNFGEVNVVGAAIVPVPTRLSVGDFERMTLGAFETCFVKSTTAGECIGDNSSGQLGRGIPADAGPDASGADNLPHPTPAPIQTSAISAANPNYQLGNFVHFTGYHEGVTLVGGQIAMWGDNNLGQLGPQVDAAFSATPSVVNLNNVTGLALLQYSSCALVTGSSSGANVYCWGSTLDGQNGNTTTVGTMQAQPTLVEGISGNATELTTGLNHACVLLTNGTMACWGDNTSGQLGRSTGTVNYSPTPGIVQF
jgi:alpha-tubulin suppressor-like RCC1 family protein